MEFKMKPNNYVCPVLDCNNNVYDVDVICAEHRIMQNESLKCKTKECTFKRFRGKDHCEHCSQKIDSLYHELHKATDKCRQIVSTMNNKYNLNYSDELYLS